VLTTRRTEAQLSKTSSAVFCSDEDSAQIRELLRVLESAPQTYRIQFLGVTTDRGPLILEEVDVRGTDLSDAIHTGLTTPWPAKATALRIVDREGREMFERLKADL
jgi:hypothetical protein